MKTYRLNCFSRSNHLMEPRSLDSSVMIFFLHGVFCLQKFQRFYGKIFINLIGLTYCHQIAFNFWTC